MILSIIIIGITLSIDSVFVGLSYGIKGTQIPNISKLVICFFSVIYSALSIASGHLLASILPREAVKILGALILALIGFAMIFKILVNEKHKPKKKKAVSETPANSIYQIILKPLGITIQILRNPDAGDMDKSGIIDVKESILLGFVLSVDALGAGIGSSLLGFGAWYFPFTIGLSQLFFLCLGLAIGKYFNSKIHLIVKVYVS